MRIWYLLVALGLILSSTLGLLVMAGGARGILSPPLQAELTVQDFPMPPDMAVDPDRVATYMARELQERLDDDVAIRLTLNPDVVKKVKEIVLPRLLNVVAVQSMLHDIPELSALLDLSSFHRTVSGSITSANAADDVALTVPNALLAAVDGQKVKVTTTSTGMPALELGPMTAGQSHQVTLWLDADATATEADLGQSILLGAANGQRGRVLLWGDHGWFGADVEALRWGRWLIGADLGAVLLFGLASLTLPVLIRRKDRPRPGLARPTETA
ncbi:MAG: hypothetical protein ABL866_00345 [Devosia sp.]